LKIFFGKIAIFAGTIAKSVRASPLNLRHFFQEREKQKEESKKMIEHQIYQEAKAKHSIYCIGLVPPPGPILA
jgi:hypothetical protein